MPRTIKKLLHIFLSHFLRAIKSSDDAVLKMTIQNFSPIIKVKQLWSMWMKIIDVFFYC